MRSTTYSWISGSKVLANDLKADRRSPTMLVPLLCRWKRLEVFSKNFSLCPPPSPDYSHSPTGMNRPCPKGLSTSSIQGYFATDSSKLSFLPQQSYGTDPCATTPGAVRVSFSDLGFTHPNLSARRAGQSLAQSSLIKGSILRQHFGMAQKAQISQ